ALRLEGPAGFTAISRTYDIQSRAPFLPISQVETQTQNPTVSWRAPADALATFQSGATARISFSNLANIDPAPLLDSLWQYPYGCSEQLTSVAMPLLYYNRLAGQANRSIDPRITRRVQDAATQLLDREGPDGAFGLWRSGDSEATPWLGAYVTDFLMRAQSRGIAVPRAPMEQAYAALRKVARLNDFGGVGYDDR